MTGKKHLLSSFQRKETCQIVRTELIDLGARAMDPTRPNRKSPTTQLKNLTNLRQPIHASFLDPTYLHHPSPDTTFLITKLVSFRTITTFDHQRAYLKPRTSLP